MSRFKVFGFVGSWVLAGLLAGCATSGSYRFSNSQDAPEGQIFFSPAPNFQSPAFLSRWSDLPGERDKIRYLLDRVGRARNQFVRNGGAHDGKMARNWLLFKSRHWVTGVSTVSDFINRVASFSMKTGKPYLVEVSDSRLYTLRSVLRNELQAFERYAGKQPPVLPTPPPSAGLPQPGPITSYLAQTPVASATT